MLDLDVLYEKIQPIVYPFIVLFVDVIKTEVYLRCSVWIEAFYKKDLFNKLKFWQRVLDLCMFVNMLLWHN